MVDMKNYFLDPEGYSQLALIVLAWLRLC